ncbi:hypothetical protein BHE74_00002005 [Ensete ventricosum]|uniref:Uncharacterized protein n=1 Tax=Ensete ventricosum TaxID=4639 RepID=A0A426XEB1_ENSVE|nr:hypothetical protein B296_00052804 [Ensete ventricosum]RWW09596.1 hypothetical protein GW17_00026910 [Ensete ventricosum]RWW89050.1 hypothetical protein BHE74_00002005 [Ensete ventricosum]RZS26939.1 hypothetical protein BHM03_00060361 [Ensete ventricosum]
MQLLIKQLQPLLRFLKRRERSLPPTLKRKRNFASPLDADSSPILAVRFARTVSKSFICSAIPMTSPPLASSSS